MKIRLSFITLTSTALLVVGASAAQARIGQVQETTAQTQAAKKVALSYQAETKLFKRWEQHQTRHSARHR
jgi:hypothetical protein